jgi:hypothetical protein
LEHEREAVNASGVHRLDRVVDHDEAERAFRQGRPRQEEAERKRMQFALAHHPEGGAGDPVRRAAGTAHARLRGTRVPISRLSHDDLRNRLVAENKRKLIAYDALRERSSNSTISFTGTRVTVEEMETHSRSEAAFHRWDLVGDDDASNELLAQPELTAHAVKVLDRMAILNESARAVGVRVRKAAGLPIRIVFRSPDQPDVVFLPSPGGGRFEIVDRAIDADAILRTDAASRLLALWGRKSNNRTVALEGAPAITEALDAVVWPNAQSWPRGHAGSM